MPLYEVAIIEVIEKKDERNKETLILEPKAIVAANDQAAGAKAIRSNSDSLPEDLDNVKVLVRPFA